jgi:DNA gyrase subunit A
VCKVASESLENEVPEEETEGNIISDPTVDGVVDDNASDNNADNTQQDTADSSEDQE